MNSKLLLAQSEEEIDIFFNKLYDICRRVDFNKIEIEKIIDLAIFHIDTLHYEVMLTILRLTCWPPILKDSISNWNKARLAFYNELIKRKVPEIDALFHGI